MDEIIVRLARALASSPRLRLVACLVRQGELTPTQLTQALRIPLNVVSRHLQILITSGLLIRRKSGVWCHYRAQSPYDASTLSGSLAGWLRIVLHAPTATRVEHADAGLQRLIIEAATAFTDLRRLQILRHLGRQSDAAAQTLVKDLSMSPQALSRHMGKLVRRGYVQTRRAGHALVFRLSRAAKTPLHRRLFEIVQAAQQQTTSRTSRSPGC